MENIFNADYGRQRDLYNYLCKTIEGVIRSRDRRYEREYKQSGDEFIHSLMYKAYDTYDKYFENGYVFIVDIMSQGASPAEILEGYGDALTQFESDWIEAGYETLFLKARSRDDSRHPVYYDISMYDSLMEQIDNDEEPTGYDESVFENY